MKKFRFLLAALIASLFIVGSGIDNEASAATWRSMTVYNNTGYTIRNLYIAARESNTWGDDLLGSSMLYNGGYTSINYDANYQYYEIRIYLTDGSYREWTGSSALNFYGSTMLVLTYIGDGRFNAKVD